MRHLIFLLWYRQWFRNHEGIKRFADQVMNWVMRSTLRLAASLKKRNKQLEEKIREMTSELQKRLQHPTIDDDDFPQAQSEVRSYTIQQGCVIIAETFFNYFAARAIFNFAGWLAVTAQSIFAIAITWIAIPLFRNLFHQIIHENPYKAQLKEERNWIELSLLILGAIVYEFGMFNLCKLRGEQIEGGHTGFITILMIVVGMLLPLVAGYFAYKKKLYYNPYINTLKIRKLVKCIASKENRIKTNLQKMETHFKRACSERFAILQEFKVYKENYNLKKGIPKENLSGHFCETQENFLREAIERYKKEAIHQETVKPVIIPQAHSNGQDVKIKELFTK